ncbi:hypothetical protein MRX96_020837 [Rhipicephalus microplus]
MAQMKCRATTAARWATLHASARSRKRPATSATSRDTSPGSASRTREGVALASLSSATCVASCATSRGTARTASGIDRKCYNCGHLGHISRDCPEAGGNDAVADVCYRCNERGHIARNCRSTRSNNRCYHCGEVDHLARECEMKA